jgi:hypothetical protein
VLLLPVWLRGCNASGGRSGLPNCLQHHVLAGFKLPATAARSAPMSDPTGHPRGVAAFRLFSSATILATTSPCPLTR